MADAVAGRTPPSVALVVVAYQAAEHLPPLLESIAALDYPADRLETIVVDNGSTDGTTELLARRYSWVRVLPQTRNLGFAEANNVGTRAVDADCVAFVNADMRLDPAWLRELVALYEPGERWSCVSSLILDWDGRLVDFAGGVVNLHGHGNQVGHGVPLEQVRLVDGTELPFACGGAMLVGREAFLDAGGFDASYFIYFEDVDLGWRLRLFGHRIRFAARARAFHRGHGTTTAFRESRVRVLYERNALRSLIKNLDDENLGRVLAPALLLLVERARLASGAALAGLEGGADTAAIQVPPLALAPLQAVGEVVAGLDELLTERRRIQARRTVGDADLLALFGRPLQPAARDDPPYLDALARIVRAFGLEDVFPTRRPVVAVATGGRRADRLDELAAALASAAAEVRRAEGEALLRAGTDADVLVVDPSALAADERLRAVPAVRAVDVAGAPPAGRADELLPADVLLCGSPQERTAWIAALEREGRLPRPGLAADMVVVGDAEGLRALVAEPWRWERLRARRAAPEPPPAPPTRAAVAVHAARTAVHRAAGRGRTIGARARDRRRATESFRCNICGAHNPITAATFTREERSCATCGSTSRWRSVVHVLSTELFGRSIALPDFPENRSLAGVGLTDWSGYAEPLAAKLDYTNTFLHTEPRLDLCALDAAWAGRFDFVLCSEVLEHVPPPVGRALGNLRALLKPDGVAVVTTPYGLDGETTEHFPDLHRWEVVERDGGHVLRNTTRDGDVQEHTDLVFHEGAGTTVEMRVFSERALLDGLTTAGFAETVVYRDQNRGFGVGWPEPWSRPIAARAATGGSGRRRGAAG